MRYTLFVLIAIVTTIVSGDEVFRVTLDDDLHDERMLISFEDNNYQMHFIMSANDEDQQKPEKVECVHYSDVENSFIIKRSYGMEEKLNVTKKYKPTEEPDVDNVSVIDDVLSDGNYEAENNESDSDLDISR